MVRKANTIRLLKSSDAVVSFKAGDSIFKEGEEGRHMFIIKTGRVELRTGHLVIGTFVPGDIIGEMALVDQEHRSAGATALSDCELVSIDNPRFQAMILETPDFAIEVMQTMSARLRNMNRETNVFHKKAETVHIQAMTDALTGVLNRRAWDDRMKNEELRCLRLGNPTCVVSIDLDGLKVINDSQGHAKGDELIKSAADALFEACRETDVVARLGGDEFGILALDCNRESANQLVLRIEETFAKRGIQASLGLAERDPESNLKTAWEEADQAMYVAKRTRKSAT